MKRYIFLSVIIVLCTISVHGQNDTLYVMKNGNVVGKYNVTTELDSVIFYPPNSSFTDSRDGNVYQMVIIGDQVWMAGNLRYLPSVSEPATGSQTLPHYYVYYYIGTELAEAKATAMYTVHGVLYNWTAAMAGFTSSTENPSGVQGVCPTGWHLPSDAEWTQLTDYLGGEEVAGKKLKDPGFSALMGGYRGTVGLFDGYGSRSFWWSSTGASTYALHRIISTDQDGIGRMSSDTEAGHFVRCVKD